MATERIINIELKNSKTIERILDLQELKTQLEMVVKSNKVCSIYPMQLKYNKLFNLPEDSKIGLLMAIAKETEL